MKITHLALAFLLTAASSMAASVTFSSSYISPDDTGSFLNNSGTILTAVSLGNTRTGPYTYNAPNASSNPNPEPTLNGISFTTANGGNPTGTYYQVGQNNGGAIGYDTGRFSTVPYTNEGLYGLVYDVARSSANNVRLTLNLTNLVPGATYSLQMIFSSLNTADNPTNDLRTRNLQIAAGTFTQGANTQVGTGSDGTSDIYSYGGYGEGSNVGPLLVTADFTADAETQFFTFLTGTEGGNSRVSLAGFVLSVPEPSAFAMTAIGMLGLILPRRRK